MRKVRDWNEYFMGIAHEVKKRSKDPSTQVGCVIVNKNNQIVGTGYNGMPADLFEYDYWQDRDLKLKTVIHSEKNAVGNLVADAKGGSAYVTLHPCSDCLKGLIAAGIKKIYYDEDREGYAFIDECKDLIEIYGMKLKQCSPD